MTGWKIHHLNEDVFPIENGGFFNVILVNSGVVYVGCKFPLKIGEIKHQQRSFPRSRNQLNHPPFLVKPHVQAAAPAAAGGESDGRINRGQRSWDTLQGINISHLGKRKIIFKYAIFGGYVSFLEGNFSTEVVATILKPKVLSMFDFNKQFQRKTYQKANSWVAPKNPPVSNG